MPLLVVAVSQEESGDLTLDEWDALCARQQVLFESSPHPLLDRLIQRGVDARPLANEQLEPGDAQRALVADPGSPLTLELARNGAHVRVGVAATPDDLSSAHASGIARRAAASLGGVAVIMARLRSSDGCPWDREQSHESLRVHLVEEAYEVLDAIDRGSLGHDLEEELGDLLLQVAFHARLAEDEGRFQIASVATRLVEKLIRRHPHVFGDTVVSGAGDVVRNWENIKGEEKARTGPFEDIPAGLPALMYAFKVQKRAAARGFNPSEREAAAEIRAALDALEEDRDVERLGDALFWLTALARARGVDPEGALRTAVAAFRESY
jgi:tetrapyrrole methylase family protein / MazG family protein